MSFIGYLDKMGLEGQEKRRDSEIPRRRGIQLNSGSQRSADSPPHSSPPSIISNADPDSIVSTMDTNDDMDAGEDLFSNSQMDVLEDDRNVEINEGGGYDEDEEDDGDPSTNPEYPCKFGPDDTFDEERLMKEEHWSRGQLDLWYKIRARGSYPLFPPHWMLDFSNLPDELFVGPGEEPIIGARNRKREVRGILAFDALMQLGGRVRDKWESGMFSEKWLGKELGKYVDWAMKDGEIPSTYTGVFAISGAPIFETCEWRMSKRMSELAERHRTALETSRQFYASRRGSLLPSYLTDPSNPSSNPSTLLPSPLPPHGEAPPANLYGFAIVGCVVALVTLNTAKLEAPTRTLLVVDYLDHRMDVWNAIAIALVVVQARDEQRARVDWARKIAAEVEPWGGEEDL
ncbi:hypothetical protein L211DRAFT_621952 [Terfezia boudieri ATCC MYA-4762]|uniref:Uncharacterized protein n=1 Tax=Terfezia boudieri ATCC MYA-4762 TaxID=1051890 RepID=A0A3N4L9K9_9PEZI|nr:hypothetical protein L211DRAFT_621952 [Terfezia boudieri ATCC MYA-4762]